MSISTLGQGVDVFFEAKSIAVVGASNDITKIGGRPIYFLKKYGYLGSIYPINAKEKTVQGLEAFSSISVLAEAPELVVLAIPAAFTIEVLKECAAKGVKGVVVLSSGFAEAGAEGLRLQNELVKIAQAHHIRLLGPNCLGALGVANNAISSFSIILEQNMPQKGSVGVVSQSGNIGSYTVQHLVQKGIGVSRFIATGNEADVDIADGIASLAKDENTKLILCCMETCRNADKLVSAFVLASQYKKPIVVLKIGSTEQGQAAAASHTGALASSDAVFNAVFSRYQVTRVYSIEELLDLTQALSLLLPSRLPTNSSVTLVAASGGFGIMMADASVNAGLSLTTISPSTQKKIAQVIPLASSNNPIDATAQMSSKPEILFGMLSALMQENQNNITQLFLALSMSNPRLRGVYIEALTKIRHEYPNQLLVVTCQGPRDAVEELQSLGIPVFPSIDATAKALALLCQLGQNATSPSLYTQEAPKTLLINEDFSNEFLAKKCLALASIPVLKEKIVHNEEEAIAEAIKINAPVVLKILSTDIPHKTEVGGVKLHLNTPQDVANAYNEILLSVKKLAPHAKIDGVLISPMAGSGTELIMGSTTDPIFGPVIMVGIGGIYAEVFKDFALQQAPVSKTEALSMIQSLKLFPLLDGARGQPKADVEAAASMLSTLSLFAVQHKEQIAEIDLNPVLVKEKGQGAVALDALFIAHDTPSILNEKEHSHDN